MASHKRLVVFLCGSVAAGATVGALRATGRPSVVPASTEAFSALRHGRPIAASSLPGSVQRFVDDVAPEMGMSAATAIGRVHLVRRSMGAAGLSIYAFLDLLGRPCFYVPTYGGICASIPHTSPPGFHWLIGSNGDGAPGYLFAIVADSVRGLSLQVDGKPIAVSLRDNVAFAQYPGSTRAKSAAVTVRYAGGRRRSARLALR